MTFVGEPLNIVTRDARAPSRFTSPFGAFSGGFTPEAALRLTAW